MILHTLDRPQPCLLFGTIASLDNYNLIKIGRAVFERTDISLFGPCGACSYFPYDTAHAALFREKVSINSWNVIKSHRRDNRHLCLRTLVKGPDFWGWNIHIHGTLDMNKIRPTVQALPRDKQHSKLFFFALRGARNVYVIIIFRKIFHDHNSFSLLT
jgi:hypothetical protein